MAKTGAKNSQFLIGIEGVPTKLLAVRDWNWNMSRGTIDVSTIDTDWKEFLAGQITATASCNLIYDPTDSGELAIAAIMRSGEQLQLFARPLGNQSGENPQWSGTAFVTQWDFSGATEDAITIAASFQFTGPITEEKVSAQ